MVNGRQSCPGEASVEDSPGIYTEEQTARAVAPVSSSVGT